MTILQLISSEGYYGAESMLVTLAQSLSRLGCKLIVGVFRDLRDPHTEVGSFAEQRGLAVSMIPCSGRWDWKAISRIRTLLDEYAVDVLHTHGYKADIYGYAASLLRRVALVATCHNWPNRRAAMRIYAAVDRLALKGYHRVATPSPLVADILKQSGISFSKLAGIGNGVDIDRFRGATPSLRAD